MTVDFWNLDVFDARTLNNIINIKFACTREISNIQGVTEIQVQNWTMHIKTQNMTFLGMTKSI